MNETPKQIFATNAAADFVGRVENLDQLVSHARSGSGPNGLAVLGAPSAGVSELLRQAYDRLFIGQAEVIPFYFEIRASDASARNAALRFLRQFLLQTVAFRRRDSSIIDASPEIAEIAELAAPTDGHWIDRLIENCDSGGKDDRSFIRKCLSAPLRAAAHGAPSFVMIDALQATDLLESGKAIFEDIEQIFSRSSVPVVLAGQRRYLFGRTPFETMHIEPFSFAEAGIQIESLAAKTGVVINDQTRDLIAVQLGGNAGYIKSLFMSAADNGLSLGSFGHLEQVYTDEIFGGRICKRLDAIVDLTVLDAGLQNRVLQLLAQNIADGDDKTPVAYWKKHLNLAGPEFDRILDTLNCHEIINLGSGSVAIDDENIVVRDYIRARASLEIDGEARALTVGETIAKNVKRAPQLMARFYRRGAAVGLRELMGAFDGRAISLALIDYSKFRDHFKGAGDDKILKAINDDNEKIVLPQIVYAAHTAGFYPQLNELCDAERSAVALGFADSAETKEVVWIAAEIDSKLEATREVAEFWCDRLEMAALSCNFPQYRLWLIAPEGFSPEAMDALGARNAYGSSRKQADLMARVFGADVRPTAAAIANEYEIVVPMGEDTEMIAAHTIEEIAKRHKFTAKAINQIKTALVEACINAAEHSLSPDRKIYQKFAVDAEKITITVSNRGLRLADKKGREVASDEGRRGWGLKLIKGLMDEVNVVRTDDGTQITMVKYLKAG